MIIQFPRSHGRVYSWARAYALIFKEKGQIEAGKYASTFIPEQFHKSLTVVAKEEYERLKDK